MQLTAQGMISCDSPGAILLSAGYKLGFIPSFFIAVGVFLGLQQTQHTSTIFALEFATRTCRHVSCASCPGNAIAYT